MYRVILSYSDACGLFEALRSSGVCLLLRLLEVVVERHHTC
jgi:hypothetical protein